MIYFVEAVGVGNIKIGFTGADDVQFRIDQLQTGCPVPLRLLNAVPGTEQDEKDLHRRFAANRVHGEWFKPAPELLALIAPAEQRECGGVQVTERSVSIRALTVGRKQMSKALLAQLPMRNNLMDWPGAFEEWEMRGGACDHEDHFVCEDENECVCWGWVKLDGERVLIVESAGALYRCRDHYEYAADKCGVRWTLEMKVPVRRNPQWRPFAAGEMDRMRVPEWLPAPEFQEFFKARLTRPGWRGCDQLFFGV